MVRARKKEKHLDPFRSRSACVSAAPPVRHPLDHSVRGPQTTDAASIMDASPFKENCLAGKVALITGGGSGIGFEIARQLGLHGAAVVLMGRREAPLRSAAGSLAAEGIQAGVVTGDVRNYDDCTRAVSAAVTRFGRLDVLVNNAAGNFLASAQDLSPNAFRTVLDIDAMGASAGRLRRQELMLAAT